MLMVWPRLLELFRGGIVFSMWYNGGKLSYRESLSFCDGTLCLPLLFIAHGGVNRLLLLHPSFVTSCITICSKWQEWGSMDLNLCVMNQEEKCFILLWFSQLHSPNYGKLTSTSSEHRSNQRFIDHKCVFTDVRTHSHTCSHTGILASREFEFVTSDCLEINFSWITRNANFPSVKNWTSLILFCLNMTREKKVSVWLIKAEQKTGQTAWRLREKVDVFLGTSTVGSRLWYFSCCFRKRHVISPSLEWF